MRKITIIAYSAFILILLVNVFFYKSLYNNQIDYIIKLLDRQVRIVGSDVENTSMYLISDLNRVDFAEDISGFFTDKAISERSIEKLKLYYSKYEDLIVSMRINYISGDVYTLFKDEDKNTWIGSTYKAQQMPEIYDHEIIEPIRENYNYFLPVLDGNKVIANFVITINVKQYFSRLFLKYNLDEYQWQWIINNEGSVFLDNSRDKPSYSELNRLSEKLTDGVSGRMIHSAVIKGKKKEILSSFYPVNLIGKDYGLVFSAPTDFFQKYIVRNSVIIIVTTLLIVLFIIVMFKRNIRKQQKIMMATQGSEATLIKLIEEMPVGIVVYNKSMEILKANRRAAQLFSYKSEEEMLGMLIPDLSRNEYVSDLSGQFGQGKVIKINSLHGERIVFRGCIPVNFKGEESFLESFIDITALESARKQEAESNIAKSELLARMSFEIRTPLNGIIGMTEMLCRSGLPDETLEVAGLLRRSADLLLNIINDIFDVSKVETGKMILDEIPFRLREEIAYCMKLVMRENPDTRVDLSQKIDSAVPDNVIGDPYRLRQIITNLLYNALSTNDDGEVKLLCRLRETNNNVIVIEFTLTDTGRSLTKAEIKKIFGDYITNRTDRSEWNEELRLGPILARQLVELMGGDLVATSPAIVDHNKQEKGLKITFTIKLHLNEKISKAIDISAYRKLSDIKTLVITGGQSRDDDFLSILHKLDIPVSVTSFQKHTISQIVSNRESSHERYIMLIIFDEPESDGFVIAEAMRDAGLTSQYIVLMFTSREPKGHYPRCVDLGIDQLFVKPFNSEELSAVVLKFFPGIKKANGTTVSKEKSDTPVVLVVDDNHLNRKVIGSLLKVLGIMADYAENGEDALGKVKGKTYDIIFMDLIMPVMDGFDAAIEILKFERSVSIIALSADNMPETKAKAELAGMKELLSKPVSVEDLRSVIEKYRRKG
jgi:signal transduction histidine kinase/CheY-like chemotaxis protein